VSSPVSWPEPAPQPAPGGRLPVRVPVRENRFVVLTRFDSGKARR